MQDRDEPISEDLGVDLQITRDRRRCLADLEGPMGIRYTPRFAAVRYCDFAERPVRADEFLFLGRLLSWVDLYNATSARVQIFGLAYSDFDPDGHRR